MSKATRPREVDWSNKLAAMAVAIWVFMIAGILVYVTR